MNYIQLIEFQKVWTLQRYLYISLFLVGILSQSFNVSSKETHDFSYSTLRIDARLEDGGSRGISIHTNICTFDLKLDDKWLGQHCLRAKVSKKNGKAQNHALIFDSNKLKSFSLETNDYDKNGNYKFWLRPQANDDTQNFNKFIKKLSSENAAVIGFLCKKIVDDGWFDKSLKESWKFANYRKSKEIFQTDAALRAFQKIANRCYSNVEKRAGVILIANTKEANSNSGNKLCGYSLVDTDQLGKNERVELQSALSTLGLYRGNLDGAFGENSCNALRAFIKLKTPENLQASTKYLGKKMLSELLTDAKQKEALPKSTSSSNLLATNESDANKEETKLCGYDLIGIEKFGKDRKADMQMALSVLEIYSGAIDGDFGKKSCKALKEFIKRKTPSYLLSSKTTFSRNELQLLLTYARELKPDIKYVLGPKIATSKKQETQPAKVAADDLLLQQIEQMKADNEVLARENSELNEEIDSKNVIISELNAKLSDTNTKLGSAESKLKSAETKSDKLKSLIAEQEKLSVALEEKMMTLETKSVSLNTKLIQAERTVVAQTNEIDELENKNTELSDTVLSLKDKQSEFSTYKSTSEKLIADLELEKNTLLDKQQELESINEKYKAENESLDKKLKKVTSKALLEGGLSGKLSSSEDAKQETNDSSSNSLGANMISKKILDNLRNEISELKKDNSEQANLIGKLKGEIQQAESKLATSNSEILNLKNDIKKQIQDIKALNEELEIATLNAEKNVNEISSLKSELTELKEYRASVIDEKAQEIENSKTALQQLFVDKKALVISSQTSEIEVLKYIDDLNNELGLSPEADTFDIFLSQDKVYAITLGIGTPDECSAMRDQLLSFDSIPEESFCGDWDGYVASFDVLDGKMIPTVGRDYYANHGEAVSPEGFNSEADKTSESIELEKPSPVTNIGVQSEEASLDTKETAIKISEIFTSPNKKKIAEYYFKLPEMGSDEFLCPYEPGATFLGNKKVWECKKKEIEEYSLNKFQDTKNLNATQVIGYNGDGTVNYAYAYLESSFPAYEDSWFETLKHAETFVEQLYGQADKREIGSQKGNGLAYRIEDYEYIHLSYGCSTYFFERPSTKEQGANLSSHRNILEEISTKALQEAIDDKRMGKFSRYIVMPEVAGADKCMIVTIAGWTEESSRMGQEDTKKVSIFVADMQTSFNGIGNWEQVQPENVKVIQKITGHLANSQLPGCWSIQQKILSVQNEDLYKQRKAEWEPVLSSYFNLSNPKKYIGEDGNELSQWEWSKPIGAMAFNIHLKNNRLNEVQKENKRCVPIVKNAMEQANELIAKGEMPAGGFNFPDK